MPYPRLLSKLVYHGRPIDALNNLPDNGDLEEIYGNILSTSDLDNMKLVKKSDVVASKVPLSVRCTSSGYLQDYLVITKMDNPGVIKNFIEHVFKEGKVITYKYISDKPTDVFKPSNKRKNLVLVVLKDV